MNNFRNPYVDPDSFQGKIYDNYRNHNTPQSLHFSLNNQEELEQKETQQKPKRSQYSKNKNQTIYINNNLEKITDAKLVMFSPPKVDSIQKPLNEHPIEELVFNIAQNKHPEKEKEDKEEVVSNLVKEFSDMLGDNSSIQEEEIEKDTFLDGNISNKLSNEYINDANNEYNTELHDHTTHENSGMLLAEFHSMLDDRKDDLLSEREKIKSLSVNTDNNIDENFLRMFLDSDELQEENQNSDTNDDIEKLNEPTDPMEEKYFTMLSESDELLEENQAIYVEEEDIEALKESTDHHLEDKYFTMLSESGEWPEENDDSDEDSGVLEETTNAIEDEYSTMLSESDGLQEENDDSVFTNSKKVKSDEIEDLSKDIHFITYVEKKKTTTVNMQVLLTKLETDIDIVETIDLLVPIETIVKIEWSIQSLDCKIIIPSKTVFMKGEFTVEIEFSNKRSENRIQSMKASIPWSKTSNINWLAVPDLSRNSQYEYMFQSPNESTPNFHYKSHQEFAEPINSQLKQINFVWHQELNPKNQHLQISGFAQLSINFMQNQLVELDCYSK